MQVFVCENAQFPARPCEQFARSQQEIGIGRPAEALVAERERFIYERAVFRQRRQDMRKQRPIQIVGNDDAGKAPAFERPRRMFQVGKLNADTGNTGQCCKRLSITIDRAYAEAGASEKSAVPTAAAGKIEHFAPGGNEAGPSLHPLGGRLQCVRNIQKVNCNQDAGIFSMLQLFRAQPPRITHILSAVPGRIADLTPPRGRC